MCIVLDIGRSSIFLKIREIKLKKKIDTSRNEKKLENDGADFLSGPETLSYLYGAKNRSRSSYEKLMEIVKNDINKKYAVPDEIQHIVESYFSVVISRAVQLHNDVETMPRNIRDGLIDAYLGVEESLKRFEEGDFSVPAIPRILSGGAALNKEEYARWERTNFAMLVGHFPRKIDFAEMPKVS